MGMINQIYAQGSVNSPGKSIYTPRSSYEGHVSNIKISNIAAYTISLFRYIKSTDSTVLMYKFILDAGDIINDTTTYDLKAGDSLYLETNTSSTIYVVTGIENLSS